MNRISFSLVFLTLFALISIYIYKRFVQKLYLGDKAKKSFSYLLILNYGGIVGYMLARYFIDIPNLLYFLFSLPIGVIFLLFCTTLFYEISAFAISKTPVSQSKRELFKKSLDISSLAAAFGVEAKSIYNAKVIEIEKVDIKLRNLKKSYKIAQISDTHIGGIIDRGFVQEIVQKTNNLNPDLVVITGDLIDVKISSAKEAIDELKNLKSTFGTYYILGNHEYFHDPKEIIEYVKRIDIRVLENESVIINDDFYLCGVYDIFGYRAKELLPDLNKALEKTSDDKATILLAHQPKFVEYIYGGVDLMLSGHTHGGQIYPFRFLVALQQPYTNGLHRHGDKMQVYVNRGAGFWGPPMRLGSSSEISDITIFS